MMAVVNESQQPHSRGLNVQYREGAVGRGAVVHTTATREEDDDDAVPISEPAEDGLQQLSLSPTSRSGPRRCYNAREILLRYRYP
jgi:hypothetical protein